MYQYTSPWIWLIFSAKERDGNPREMILSFGWVKWHPSDHQEPGVAPALSESSPCSLRVQVLLSPSPASSSRVYSPGSSEWHGAPCSLEGPDYCSRDCVGGPFTLFRRSRGPRGSVAGAGAPARSGKEHIKGARRRYDGPLIPWFLSVFTSWRRTNREPLLGTVHWHWISGSNEGRWRWGHGQWRRLIIDRHF